MNAEELYLSTGKPTGVFYCTSCRIVHRTKDGAESCCKPSLCKDCGKELPQKTYSLQCDTCKMPEWHRKDREIYQKAKKVKLEDYEGSHVVIGDDYVSVDELEEQLSYRWSYGDELPRFAHGTTQTTSVTPFDVADVMEQFTQEAYEDFDYKDLLGLDDLQKAIEAFHEINKNHWANRTHNWDGETVVLFEELADKLEKEFKEKYEKDG